MPEMPGAWPGTVIRWTVSVNAVSGASAGDTDQMLCAAESSTTVRNDATSGRCDSCSGSWAGRNRTVTPAKAPSSYAPGHANGAVNCVPTATGDGGQASAPATTSTPAIATSRRTFTRTENLRPLG